MTRKSKIYVFGCLTPLLLIGLCATAIYFRSNAVLGAVAGLWGESTEEVLADLSENQVEPAFDWTVISERSNPINSESSGSTDSQTSDGVLQPADPLPEPAVVVAEEVNVVRVKVQNQTGQIDTQAAGVSRSAEIVDEAGQSSYVFEYNEADLNEVVLTTAAAEMPAEFKDRVILQNIDLEPGALIIEGQVDPGTGSWQSLGIIATMGIDGKSLQIVGIDIGGSVLDASAVGPMQELFGSVERDINSALRDFAVISGGGLEVPLNQIYLGDGILQIVFDN